jgi:uncharacterized protein (DUF983 family)
MARTIWQPDRIAATKPGWPVPPLGTAIARGLIGHCPACGNGPSFRGFLKVVPRCRFCTAPLGLARADDAPPYFTILLVGHIVVPLMLLMERVQNPPDWEVAAIFLPLTAVLCVALLRPIKGGVLGAIVSLEMLKQADSGE